MLRAFFVCLLAAIPALAQPSMLWGDSSRLGRPFAKDPSVIRFGGRYLLYYSMPGKQGSEGWAVGIAESRNLIDWTKVGEVLPEGEYETKGLAAPFARVVDGKVHLFYQTYGNGRNDAICHAVSDDGLRFRRNPTNPVFKPTGTWNAGRAIDAEVFRFKGKWYLYAATRDPQMKVQMLVGAVSAKGFDRGDWKQLPGESPLKPELPWERSCIEAPTVVVRGDTLYMFYAGGYNNEPQQIGVARSKDGVRWERVSNEPLVPNGPAGAWNESESGHPGAFVDDDGRTYLFYQGNADKGRTWFLSFVPIVWRPEGPQVARPIDVAKVWAGHPVGFDIQTFKDRQFVAFYDAERQMTIAARTLGSSEWTFAKLPSKVGWDSHNYIAMAIDDDGHLHVSGNMHVHPLVYFRTSRPLDITSFEPLHTMTGNEEKRSTYPVFFKGPAGELVFGYRDGSSGNGNQIYNVYDVRTRVWRRLLDTPLTDGEGLMNAYPTGPVRGPDGFFHLIWVWRDTPDAATNHDLSYARSKDLVHWETGAGKPVTLPMKLGTAEVIDPVPAGGGIINGGASIGFDSRGRVLVAYHKYDAAGFTQPFIARLENGKWTVRPIAAKWEYRWAFAGNGSLGSEVRVESPQTSGGRVRVQYRHIKYGSGAWLLDEQSLHVVGTEPYRTAWPAWIERTESSFPGVSTQLRSRDGFALRWETLGANRDRPRTGPVPEPSMLRVYDLRDSGLNGRDERRR